MTEENMSVHIDGYSFTDNLGAVNKNFVTIWFHGCDRNCKGCISREWNERPEAVLTVTTDFLAQMIADDADERSIHIDGFVFSGGEPFRQAKGVREFFENVVGVLGYSPDVMVYTGFTYDEILSSDNSDVKSLLDIADVLVDGSYIEELDFNMPYMGSINQKMHFLSEKYSEKDFPPERGRVTSISSPDGDGLCLVGIPTSEAKVFWNELKNTLLRQNS